ncbi:MAG: hypothetical protein LBM77_13310 [Spirochaetaceae bacterium]|jgi:hypothetical protein|nr:hypothetical protein [Spirochaetaceae bacterium]
MKKLFAAFVCFILLTCCAYTQTQPASRHQGAVNAIAYTKDSRSGKELAISAGDDGFVVIWNTQTQSAESRFQVSNGHISAIVVRPGSAEFAIIENISVGNYSVSAWNYNNGRGLWRKNYTVQPQFIQYSARGSMLIVSLNAKSALYFLSPQNGGEIRRSIPNNLSGPALLASTSNSENALLLYSGGNVRSEIVLWDWRENKETYRYSFNFCLSSPALLNFNSILAGWQNDSFLIINAVTGTIINKSQGIPAGFIAQGPLPGGESAEIKFYIVSPSGGVLYRLSNAGLFPENIIYKPQGVSITTIKSIGDNYQLLAMGGDDGKLYVFNNMLASQQALSEYSTANQLKVTDAKSSLSLLAWVTGDNTAGIIPLDPNQIQQGDIFSAIPLAGQNRVSVAKDASPDTPYSGSFLFWPDTNTSGQSNSVLSTSSPPLLMDVNLWLSQIESARYYQTEVAAQKSIEGLRLQQSIVVSNHIDNKLLFLDAVGNISIYDNTTDAVIYSTPVLGALDAVFLDTSHILIGRSSLQSHTNTGMSPLLQINFNTGETVSINYNTAVVARLLLGKSNNLYLGLIDVVNGKSRTRLMRAANNEIANAQQIDVVNGEDSTFSIAEANNGIAASNLGGSAKIYSGSSYRNVDRSYGNPLRLCDGGTYFIMVDETGSLCWYNAQSGRIVALLRIYKDFWSLERAGSKTISGTMMQLP